MRIVTTCALLLALAVPAAAHVSLGSPNGGESFSTGETVTIRWHIYLMHNLMDWDLWFATDAGAEFLDCDDEEGPSWIPIELDWPPTCSDGGGDCGVPGGCMMEYQWTVPEGIASETVKVRVRMDNASMNDYYDVSDSPFTIVAPTAAPGEPAAAAPRLAANPNPFNPRTSLRYRLDAPGEARLEVFDLTGRRVAILAEGWRSAGEHVAVWDGRDGRGTPLPSGIYLARLAADGGIRGLKLTLLE